jgi:hypothetical protein
VEVKLLHANGRTEGRDEANRLFSLFAILRMRLKIGLYDMKHGPHYHIKLFREVSTVDFNSFYKALHIFFL